jgi:hypothetical protein
VSCRPSVANDRAGGLHWIARSNGCPRATGGRSPRKTKPSVWPEDFASPACVCGGPPGRAQHDRTRVVRIRNEIPRFIDAPLSEVGDTHVPLKNKKGAGREGDVPPSHASSLSSGGWSKTTPADRPRSFGHALRWRRESRVANGLPFRRPQPCTRPANGHGNPGNGDDVFLTPPLHALRPEERGEGRRRRFAAGWGPRKLSFSA